MANRLAQAKSLYLRKHALNPIDWWYWCDEALATASSQNKPIFLSIGYSSCHWCTVMEGGAFSNLEIASYINDNFLPIKVDREERPDLDSIYMQALQMMSGQGGWPLNIFLSPEDLVPFYAGTYFPVESRYGRPGFLQVLQALRQYYDTEKADLQKRKAVILEALLESAALEIGATQAEDSKLLQQGWESSTKIITPQQLGNRFPMISYAELSLRGTRFKFESKYDAKACCKQRALDLTLGGIFDHVAGGFHRYTVDPTWTVPHFEKMLYDNGLIVEYLANIWSTGFQEPAFARAVSLTVDWLSREMTAPSGYFYAAQDADSFVPPLGGQKGRQEWGEPEEGAFYVWSYNELEQLLTPDELTELQQQFIITTNGNFESKNVLQRHHAVELSDTVEAALQKLFVARYGAIADTIKTFPPAHNNQEAKTRNWQGRIPPVTDTKMIVAWNSLMISGLARAYVVFQVPRYLELATGAANFILKHQYVDGRLFRLNYEGEAKLAAQSEDYAFLIKALLDLHQAYLKEGKEEQRFLKNAIVIQEEFDKYLWSPELGGYYNTASDSSQDLIVRERSYQDNATPSANGIAVANLVRLALLTDNLHYLDLASVALKAFRGIMSSAPQACPSLFSALDWYRNSTLVRTNFSHIDLLSSQYLPTVVFSEIANLPEGSIGLVCQGLKCLPAPESLEQLLQQVQQSLQRI
ncbi:MAG: thioredoxin domain-containing protein [Calothrix sp. C42_A2020_038]|nr:thioredoxin domain-containing protein [Calothrix sp. C42_A2020_038]